MKILSRIPSCTYSQSHTPKARTVKDVLSQLPSRTVLTENSITSIPSSLKLKYDLINGIDTQPFTVLETLFKISNRPDWRQHLKPQEMTYFLGKLITFQISQMVYYTYSRTFESPSINKIYNSARFVKSSIRTIYGNIINLKSIYGNQSRINQKVHELSIKDYENLIVLEYGNNKLDLVDKWLHRFETVYGKEKLTLEMWDIKLKMNGGDPRYWNDYKDKKSMKRDHKVSRSYYKLRSYQEIINEYVHSGGQIQKLLQPLIYCCGFHNDTSKILNIANNYKMDSQINKAIIISLAYNNKFKQIQQILKPTTSEFTSSDWSQVFKYVERHSRVNTSSLLDSYIQQNPLIKDYEDLKTRPEFQHYQATYATQKYYRESMFKILLTQYLSTGEYSLGVYRHIRKFLKYNGTSSQYNQVLTNILTHIQKRSKSFDRKQLHSNGLNVNLYDNILNDWINQIEHKSILIKNWALDSSHERRLMETFKEEEEKDTFLDLF
ncbi:hypothetical protein CLIB1444_23S00914 [[Candida] jaroonii]|uniref:Uncharacterized protein n=1 Tax=[Candida] jaroonii TaxID=467808 RepID=A0ACA9YG58_9ASCO|nr:hypothetical protein CLIB1444_23S00914 [[Candida] jaroonii]